MKISISAKTNRATVRLNDAETKTLFPHGVPAGARVRPTLEVGNTRLVLRAGFEKADDNLPFSPIAGQGGFVTLAPEDFGMPLPEGHPEFDGLTVAFIEGAVVVVLPEELTPAGAKAPTKASPTIEGQVADLRKHTAKTSGKVWASFKLNHADDTSTYCVAFGQTAIEILDQTWNGASLRVSGKLEDNTWTGRDGKERSGERMVVQWHGRPAERKVA